MNFKIFSVQRKSKFESRFHPEMGHLITRVTFIRRNFLGIPFQTLHEYRETYDGKIKDCKACKVSRVEPKLKLALSY